MPAQTSGLKQFFARAEEVLAILNELRETSRLWTVILDDSLDSLAHIVGPTETLALRAGNRLYVSGDEPPAEVEGRRQNDLNPMEHGWVRFDLGKEDELSLEMSNIAFKSPSPGAAKLFSQLKRRLMKQLSNGVYGIQGDARRRYPSIAFSTGALELFRCGREWHPTFGGRSRFEPDVAPTLRSVN
jgi:hypothetical protein